MIPTVVRPGDHKTVLLSRMALLVLGPASVAPLLAGLGYRCTSGPAGLVATLDGGRAGLTLVAAAPVGTIMSVRKEVLVGPGVGTCATIAALLTALAQLAPGDRPERLLILTGPSDASFPGHLVSLEGGVTPRIWPGCFGRMDFLVRVTGQAADPGRPGLGVNAIEASIPILQSLTRLAADVGRLGPGRPVSPDSPLQPRLSITAVHGGFHDGTLPKLCDIGVTRRYDPTEDSDQARWMVERSVAVACHWDAHVDCQVVEHVVPSPDPEAGMLGAEADALAFGWGWPHTPFRTAPPLLQGARHLGGLDRPHHWSLGVSLDDMAALVRSLCYYLTA